MRTLLLFDWRSQPVFAREIGNFLAAMPVASFYLSLSCAKCFSADCRLEEAGVGEKSQKNYSL
jgi:hypothetical protein